jgi:hypothetical protein
LTVDLIARARRQLEGTPLVARAPLACRLEDRLQAAPERRQIVLDPRATAAKTVRRELRMLGFDVSERTVSRYLPRKPSTPDAFKRWLTCQRLSVLDLSAPHG